jgi:hypothetical protein
MPAMISREKLISKVAYTQQIPHWNRVYAKFRSYMMWLFVSMPRNPTNDEQWLFVFKIYFATKKQGWANKSGIHLSQTYAGNGNQDNCIHLLCGQHYAVIASLESKCYQTT